MVKASFEHEGNIGLLMLTTHFGKSVEIACDKQDDEIFRLGGTAINEVVVYEGLVLRLENPCDKAFPTRFRAFYTPEEYFESDGILSDEEWNEADRHCWITEYYDLDMEGKAPSWFISKTPIKDAHYLFVNVDIIDGGGNIIKKYRVSPFTGEYKVITNG